MEKAEMLVAMFSVFCGTGMICFIFYNIREMVTRRPSKDVAAELKALREEVAALKARNNDVLLSLETVQQQLDSKLFGTPALPRREQAREEELPLRTRS